MFRSGDEINCLKFENSIEILISILKLSIKKYSVRKLIIFPKFPHKKNLFGLGNNQLLEILDILNSELSLIVTLFIKIFFKKLTLKTNKLFSY